MNYLIDADVALITNGQMNQKFYDWMCGWSKHASYYLITQLDFDNLFETIGKTLVYNAQAIYADGGRSIYIHSRLIEHDDAISNDLSKIQYTLPTPLTYYGQSLYTSLLVGNSYYISSWQEFWQKIQEEQCELTTTQN